MSIDIVPENQRSGDVGHIPPMLLPQDAASRYAQRAARLQALAAGHVMGDYLQLAAFIVNAQQRAARPSVTRHRGRNGTQATSGQPAVSASQHELEAVGALAGSAGCSAGRGSYRCFCRNACRSG